MNNKKSKDRQHRTKIEKVLAQSEDPESTQKQHHNKILKIKTDLEAGPETNSGTGLD
jgi:hypothetical protein